MRATSAPAELQAAFAYLEREMLSLHELIKQFVGLRCQAAAVRPLKGEVRRTAGPEGRPGVP